MKLEVGRQLKVGWNTAKLLGDVCGAYETAIIIAIGHDWVVVRDYRGHALTGSIPPDTGEDISELILRGSTL